METKRIAMQGLLALTAFLSILPGCTKGTDVFGTGNQVRITASIDGSPTRTAFGEEVSKQLKINWVLGDCFTVYSDKARHIHDSSKPTADYIVQIREVTPAEDMKDRAIVDPVDHNGLQWGTAHGPFSFFAGYPASKVSFSADDPSDASTAIMSAEMPVQQDWDLGTVDMDYAYMFASKTVSTNGTEVRLDFYPMFTAFQFTVGRGENDVVTLRSFKFISDSQPITGKFEVACSTGTVTAKQSAMREIHVNLDGVVLDETSPTVTFQVLALPQDLTDLSVVFTGDEIGKRSLALNYSMTTTIPDVTPGSPIVFAGRRKHVLVGLSFPKTVIAEEGGVDPFKEDILWDVETAYEGIIWDSNVY